MQSEEDAEGRDVQHQGQQTPEQQVRKDLRTYMRARRMGAVGAYWNLFEFRHVIDFPIH